MPLNASDAVSQAKTLLDFHRTERDHLDKIRRYWKAKQRLPGIIPHAAPAEVRAMARIARVPVCDIVVNSLAQSLFLDGFRAEVESDAGEQVDANVGAWSVWQANRMDRWQSGIHRAAVAYGTAYGLVLPSEGGGTPVMRGASPRKLTALYGEDPDWPVWALEKTGPDTFKMYDEEAEYFLGFQGRRASFDSRELVLLETREHPLGVCPVVRFLDEVDLDADDEVDEVDEILSGQVAPLMPLQDQIDLTTFGLLVAQHYSAFRQRYAIGWIAESEAQLIKSAASQLWTFDENPDEMKLGEFSETNLKGYIDSREASLRHAATLSQTPVHELIGELVNLSAEALAAAEAGRERKVDERKTGLGESWEQMFWLAGQLTGDEIPDDSQAVWRDTSARSFAATVDGLGKLVQMLNIPPQALWERVPGATQQDIRRWEALAASGDSFAMLSELLERQAGLEPEPEPAIA